MPALTSSAVTVNDTWKEGGTSSRKFLAKDVTLTTGAASNGSIANPIPASLFGMTRIVEVRGARQNNNSMLNAWPSFDGTILCLSSPESATAQTPTDITLSARMIVVGKE